MKTTVLSLLPAGTVFLSLAGKQGSDDHGTKPSGRWVAIPFDDLPMAGEQLGGSWDLDEARLVPERLLETLKARRVPAIGFVNESKLHVPNQMDARIALLDQWLDAGMELGNHTFSHPNLHRTPLAEYQEDVIRAGPMGISRLHRWTLENGVPTRFRGEPDPPKFILDAYRAATR